MATVDDEPAMDYLSTILGYFVGQGFRSRPKNLLRRLDSPSGNDCDDNSNRLKLQQKNHRPEKGDGSK
jgi:hypothetical protein